MKILTVTDIYDRGPTSQCRSPLDRISAVPFCKSLPNHLATENKIELLFERNINVNREYSRSRMIVISST